MTAIEELDPVGQARASALCMAQLATLQLEAGVVDEGVHWGRRVLEIAAGIRSARLTEYLNQLRIAAKEQADEAAVEELVDELAEWPNV